MSSFVPSGAYTYTVANSAVQYLGAGQTKTDTFTVAATGNSKVVTFTITGVNDAAVIGNPTVSTVTEDLVTSGNLTATGSISISDVDQGEGSFNTGVIAAGGNLGSLVLAANGGYTYSVANTAVHYLEASEQKIDSFTVTALDGTTKVVTFTINGVNMALATTTMPGATYGSAYSQVLDAATGGAEPYTYTLTSGALPAGLTFNAASRTVSGTPTTTGTFTFVVTATDSDPTTANTATASYTVTVTAPTMALATTTMSGATYGSAYSQVLDAATGGVGPYTYALTSGALPSGLTFNAASRTVSGTPTTTGTFNFVVTATDSDPTTANTATASYTVTVTAPTMALATTTMSGAAFGSAYSQVLDAATGGVGPYTYALTSGALPAGLTFNAASRTVSGTPTTTGTFTFVVTATDSDPTTAHTATASYTVTVTAPTMALATTTMSGAAFGSAYSQVLDAATGGVGPYTYALTAGALPAGLTFNAASRTVSGTPTTTGTFTFDVTATDSDPTTTHTATASYTVTVTAPTMALATTTMSGAAFGSAYSQVLDAATGGVGPYTYALTSGALPAGLTFNAASRTVSGTPTTTGTFTFDVTATDSDPTTAHTATASYTVTVTAPTMALATTTMSGAAFGSAYSQVLDAATGGVGPYTYALTSGALPAGLTFNAASRTVSGTPTTTGTFTFVVTATDSDPTTAHTATASYTVTVTAPTMALATTTMSGAAFGSAYSQVLDAATGGVGPYTYALTAGALPAGLTFNAASRTVSGTPTTTGTFTFDVTATDSDPTTTHTATASYTVTVTAPTMALATTTMSGAAFGSAYSQVLDAATGGVGPYTYALTSGALPAGLTFNAASRTVSGTPTTTGTFTFDVTATDSDPTTTHTATASYTVTVTAPTMALATTTMSGAAFGSAYSQVLDAATGGVGPYTYALTAGALPAGLTFNAASRTVSGTPTTTGTFTFDVTATDSDPTTTHTATASYTVTVTAPTMALATTTMSGAAFGSAYSQVLDAATGGVGPYTYALTSGALPAGLTFNAASRTVSGTPTTTGTFTFDVTATDSDITPHQITAAFSLLITDGKPVVIPDKVVEMTGPSTIDLTAGASNGPFTDANIVTIEPSRAGRAQIILGRTASLSPEQMFAGHYYLDFVPNPNFRGTATVTYTLSNVVGSSAMAAIRFTIEPQEDPSKNAEVVGILNAQKRTAERFAATQTRNVNGRLEQLHDATCQKDSFGIRLSAAQEDETDNDNNPMTPNDSAGTKAQNGKEERIRLSQRIGHDPASTTERRVQAPSEACSNEGIAIWTGGMVDFGRFDTSGSDIFQYTTVGISGGLDYRFSERLTAGLAVGFNADKSKIGDDRTTSSARGFTVATYASYSPAPDLFLDGLVGINLMTFESKRSITISDGVDDAIGDRQGRQVFASVTGGYEYRQGGLLLSPYARLTGAYTQLDPFREQGGGDYSLRFGRQSFTNFSSYVGVRGSFDVAFDWGVLTPGIRIEWGHDFENDSTVDIQYAVWDDDATYRLETDRRSDDYIPLSLDADLRIGDSTSLDFSYSTLLALSDEQKHSFRFTLRKVY